MRGFTHSGMILQRKRHGTPLSRLVTGGTRGHGFPRSVTTFSLQFLDDYSQAICIFDEFLSSETEIRDHQRFSCSHASMRETADDLLGVSFHPAILGFSTTKTFEKYDTYYFIQELIY